MIPRGAVAGIVVLFTLLGAGVALNFFIASRHYASQQSVCQQANQSRAEQIGLWEFVIHISRPPPRETLAEKTQREQVIHQFEAHLHRVYAPLPC